MIFSRRIYPLLLAVAGSSFLLNCQTWDLPIRKTQRQCTTPGGQFGSTGNQLQVQFTISQPTGNTDRVDWDFGNAKTQSTNQLTVAHTYAAKGTYPVKATMTNLCGQTTTLTMNVKVTDAVSPTVVIVDATDITKSSAALRMMVTNDGKAPITEYGIVYSKTNARPTLADSKVPGNGTINVSSVASLPIASLEPRVTYYARAYARNEANPAPSEPSYSPDVYQFKVIYDPLINLSAAPVVTKNSALIGFTVTDQGNPVATQYGIVYSETNNTPTVENSSSVNATSFNPGAATSVTLNGLTIDKTYTYRPFSRAANGTITYGPSGTFSTVDIASDLIINVPFSNQSLSDQSGNNNDARPVGSPTFASDRKGVANSAILLNGTNQYFYFIDGAALRPSALTISLWVRANALTGPMQLYNKSNFNDSNGEQYSSLIRPAQTGSNITINTDIKQNGNCMVAQGWQTFPVTSSIPIVNTWRHIVFTYEGRTARMYLDGTLLSERTDLPASSMDNCAGGDLKFGAQIKTFPQYFNGSMDDVRVYRRALTSTQVKALFDL